MAGRGRDLGLRTVRREDGTGGEEASQRVVRDAPNGRPWRDPIDQLGEVDGAPIDPDPVLLLDAGDRGRPGQVGARVLAKQVVVSRYPRNDGEAPGSQSDGAHGRPSRSSSSWSHWFTSLRSLKGSPLPPSEGCS